MIYKTRDISMWGVIHFIFSYKPLFTGFIIQLLFHCTKEIKQINRVSHLGEWTKQLFKKT